MLLGLLVTAFVVLLFFFFKTKKGDREDLGVWLVGVGMLTAFAVGMLPLLGHQEPVETIDLAPDSVRIAYDPEEDMTSIIFEDTEGTLMTMNLDEEVGGSYKTSGDAELIKSVLKPYPLITPWSWPLHEYTVTSPN